MPKKTKEPNELIELENENKKTNTDTKKEANTKAPKTVAKKTKVAEKKSAVKKEAKKSTTTKKKTATKKSTTAASKKTTSTTSKSSRKKVVKPIISPVEYYDLPYRYNQTIVKVLAQTPTNLFVYWDISDEDRENYKKIYGENFFEVTKPVLIITNKSLDYSFEVDINDFANSWYLHVADSKCEYTIELGRRPISKNTNIDTDYIYVSSSNEIQAPNDKILFNNDEHMVYFKNIKTEVQSTKSISFIKNMGKVYNIYDLYKEIYQEQDINNISNTSSTFK